MTKLTGGTMALVTFAPMELHFGKSNEAIVSINRYLSKFGYLTKTADHTAWTQESADALRQYQLFFQLTPTGHLDLETAALMSTPRCGVPDTGPTVPPAGRESECMLRGTQTRTFFYLNFPADLHPREIQERIVNAINKWRKYLPFDIRQNSDIGTARDFWFGWTRLDHDDGSPFDGRGGILAHAFLPGSCGGRWAGQCHFDTDERWGFNHSNLGAIRDFESVALHEIGHLLGLTHSSNRDMVMASHYYMCNRRELGTEDVSRIRSLYGT